MQSFITTSPNEIRNVSNLFLLYLEIYTNEHKNDLLKFNFLFIYFFMFFENKLFINVRIDKRGKIILNLDLYRFSKKKIYKHPLSTN